MIDFNKQQREHAPIHIDGNCSAEGGKLYVPRRTHHRQTEMVHPNRQCDEEGATAPLQPQEAEEIWLVTQNPDKLLQMHN